MLQKKSLEQREHGNAKQIIFSETPSDDTLQGFSIAINEDSESENAVQFDSTDDEESRHHQRFLPVSSNLPRT